MMQLRHISTFGSATAAVNIICQARHNFGNDYPLFSGLASGGVLNPSCLHALCKHGDGGADAMTYMNVGSAKV